MSQYRNRACKPFKRPVAVCRYDCASRYRCYPYRNKHFILTLKKLMHIIDARCCSGSETALIEIEALFLVFLLMTAGLQLTITCRSRRKF